MEAKAISRHIRQAPRKVRRTLDLVRGKNVSRALTILQYSPTKASKIIMKTINSAVANLATIDEEGKINPDELVVRSCFVDGGPMMKRIRPRAMGRAFLIRRRTSHLTVVVSEPKS
ncbi:50S ribosomal protein L22 [bacterium]|nr:50S ribosomal protein L22 [bacterium]MBL7052414.1 50S ribosomal protein L22 [Candidatus Neomarinimicrobiota bacterium]